MKRKLAFIAIIAVALSCQRELSPNMPTGELLYFTSFENMADLQSWWGLSETSWRTDVPPNGGAHSVLISGGCIMPHARYDIGSQDKEVVLGLRCWGKNLSNGGVVSLRWKENHKKEIRILIKEKRWMPYESTETLLLPAGVQARLELFSGGFVASSMLIDLPEVYVVE